MLSSEEASLVPPLQEEDDIRGDDSMEGTAEWPNMPAREISVIVYTPSKTWVPPDDVTRSVTPVAMKEEDDKTSVFSITDYGALDWDHSGGESEFERSPVALKVTRRASSAYPTRRKSLLNMDVAFSISQRRPRAKSCPAPVSRKAPQPRDVRGRFARKGSLASGAPVIPMRANPPRRASSSAGERPPKRDSRGRFAKTPSKLIPATVPVVEIQSQPEPALAKNTKAKRLPAKSPYFPAPISPPKTPNANNKDTESPTKAIPSKRSPGLISCIPFPPLSAPYFGLIQEKLAHDPFRLLVAVTFLIRTHGKHAIPVFYELMEKYPTPQSLIEADKEDIVSIIRHLGLQNSRAAMYQTYAKIWLEDPPMKGKRYAVKDYPEKGSGRDITRDEVIADHDPRIAWEIGHMTSGPYALDSWRIFCRDILRGVATNWNGEGAQEEGFQPEWMRVLPEDKELRAYLRWMWLKEGFEWNPFTGEKDVASPELARAAMEGRIAWDDKGGMRILEEVVPEDTAEIVQGGLGFLAGKDEIPDSDVDDDDDGLVT